MSSLLPFYAPIGLEAGLDEAGRGCLAGPVVAAAVILPRDFHHPFLTDSKQMTLRQRNELKRLVREYAIDLYTYFIIRGSYIPPKISLSKQSQRAFWAEEFDGISTKMVIFLCF